MLATHDSYFLHVDHCVPPVCVGGFRGLGNDPKLAPFSHLPFGLSSPLLYMS